MSVDVVIVECILRVKVLDMVEVGAVDEVRVIGLCEVVFEVVAIFEIGAWLLTGLCEVVVDLVVVECGVDCKVFEGLCLRLWFCLRSWFCLRLGACPALSSNPAPLLAHNLWAAPPPCPEIF